MENIKFARLEKNLVLLTYSISGIKLKFTGLDANIPIWFSVDEDVSMPYNHDIQQAYKAWKHNQTYADIIAPLKQSA